MLKAICRFVGGLFGYKHDDVTHISVSDFTTDWHKQIPPKFADVDREADTTELPVQITVSRVIHITRRVDDVIRIEWCVPDDTGNGTLKSAKIPTRYSVSDVMSYINAGYRPNSYQLGFIVNSVQPGINTVQSLLNQLVTDGFMQCTNGVYWLSQNTSLSNIRWEQYTYPKN